MANRKYYSPALNPDLKFDQDKHGYQLATKPARLPPTGGSQGIDLTQPAGIRDPQADAFSGMPGIGGGKFGMPPVPFGPFPPAMQPPGMGGFGGGSLGHDLVWGSPNPPRMNTMDLRLDPTWGPVSSTEYDWLQTNYPGGPPGMPNPNGGFGSKVPLGRQPGGGWGPTGPAAPIDPSVFMAPYMNGGFGSAVGGGKFGAPPPMPFGGKLPGPLPSQSPYWNDMGPMQSGLGPNYLAMK
jgi:hypothetical protein